MLDPIVPLDTEVIGVAQTDVIVRGALVVILDHFRKNPFYIDYALASLPQDALTAHKYGTEERARAKEWFIKTNIPIIMTPRPFDGNPEMPCVALSCLSDDEANNTLGDVHYEPREEVEQRFANLTPPFHPVSYSALTGIMVVPDTIAANLTIASETMAVLDAKGRAHVIQDVYERNRFSLLEGTVANFNPCSIRPAIPPIIAGIESMVAKESFGVTCCTVGEPDQLTWLHSIVKFALLFGRQEFLEARGFGESSISSRGVESGMFGADAPQPGFFRTIILTGNVRNTWPKLKQRILSVELVLAPHNAGNPIVDDDADFDGDEDNLSGLVITDE